MLNIFDEQSRYYTSVLVKPQFVKIELLQSYPYYTYDQKMKSISL